MYAEKIIEANCDAYAAKEGWRPQRHSLGEVLDFNENLNKILRFESNSKFSWPILTRNISENYRKKIKQWVENEQLMCALDSNYWETRYAYVVDEGGNLKKFANRKSQEVFDQIIAQFDEKQVSIQILCLDPDTKVLTAGLQWVKIDDVKVGDELISTDEGETPEDVRARYAEHWKRKTNGTWKPKGAGERISDRKMRTCTVEAKWDTYDYAIKVKFDDERTVIGSPDHMFLAKQKGGSGAQWRKIKDFCVGDEIRWITKPWGDSSFDDGWFGGFIDGEGSQDLKRSGADVRITQRENEVLKKARRYLEERGYNYYEQWDMREAGPTSKLGSQPVSRVTISRMDELFRLFGQTRPERFVHRRWWEGKSLPGKKVGLGWAKIVSIEILRQQRLVDLQTSTKTFIAEGFVTHNCLKGRQVGATTKVSLKFIHRMLFIPNTLAIMASVQAEKSKEIEVKLNAAYKGCPFWLVPAWRTKKELHNGSRLNIESGMQPKGIAQGKTPSCLVPSSLVRVANGFVKKIVDVTEKDSIITHTGKLLPVKESFQTLRGPDFTRILKLWGHYSPLECTQEHRIYTPEGWIEASEISVGDYVCHPVRPITKELKTSTAYTRPTGRSTEKQNKYFDFPLSPALGYLCGFYLAEGSCHGNKTKGGGFLSELIFGVHKREIKDRLKSIRAALGKNQSVRVYDKGGNGAAIIVTNAWLTRWIAEHFGRTTKKTVPDWAWKAGRPFCKALLHGYMDGDGHCDKQSNNVVAPSICQQLILQMRDLVASLGLGWSSVYMNTAEELLKYGKPRKDVWKLILSGPTGHRYRKLFGHSTKPTKNGTARHWRYSRDRKNIEIMVESVANGFSDKFYDIEIAHFDHSFTTDQCAVHNCVHISEISLIPNPKNVIEEGLLPATHSNKNLFMVFEGTGSGNVGWFPDFWRDQKKNYPLGLARMCPIFIPWPMATDLYPQEDWLREYPVPLGFFERRTDATKKHVARCESFIRNTDYLSRVTGPNYRMPIEQQWFWEFEYRQARERHTLQQHAARMPADDFEALTGVHDTVFDPEVISEVEEHVYEVITDRVTGADIKQRKESVKSYAIVGHSIDYKFDPDENTVDEYSPIIDITWTNNRDERYDWQMIPLLPFNEDNEIETMDRLIIFEEPQRGFEYSLGIDTAHGLGKPDEERFCGSMTKVGKGGGYDVQVCEYTSNRLSPSQAVPFMACLAAHYGQKSGNPRGVKFTIEQVEGPGDTCQNQLKIMGFNWHYTPGRLDGRKIKDENRHREGFYSNKTTVPILMDRFVEAFNGGWYRPKSKYLIEECKSLERHMVSGGRDKMEHQKGKFDDRIRAAAMSYLSSHTYDDLTARSQKRYAVPNRRKVDPNEGRCQLNSISVGDLD